MVKDTDWAWLAGMMNGDGCFSLNLRKRDKRWKCELSITLTQTDPCLIERTVSILNDGLDLNPHIQEYAPSGAGKNTRYNVRIGKMVHMARLIRKLVQYMEGAKEAKARLMLRYIENRMQYEGEARRCNQIIDDPVALNIAKEFYELNDNDVPKEIVTALRDYPEMEYTQAGGSAKRA